MSPKTPIFFVKLTYFIFRENIFISDEIFSSIAYCLEYLSKLCEEKNCPACDSEVEFLNYLFETLYFSKSKSLDMKFLKIIQKTIALPECYALQNLKIMKIFIEWSREICYIQVIRLFLKTTAFLVIQWTPKAEAVLQSCKFP